MAEPWSHVTKGELEPEGSRMQGSQATTAPGDTAKVVASTSFLPPRGAEMLGFPGLPTQAGMQGGEQG
jgi:hypothetical protein